MHQQRRQARAFIRNFDVLDARAADDRGGVAERLHRLRVDVHPALRLRLQEALAGLVVARRAQEAGRRGVLVAVLLGGAAARLDHVAHAGPFLEPGIVVADLAGERAADAIDLVDLGAAPRRAGEADHAAPSTSGNCRESRERPDRSCGLPPTTSPNSKTADCCCRPRLSHSPSIPGNTPAGIVGHPTSNVQHSNERSVS